MNVYFQRRVNPTSQFEQGDRLWRQTWLRDQKLTARDRGYNTYENPEYYRATHNIFRRIWQWPMRQFEFALAKMPFCKTPQDAYMMRYKTRLILQMYTVGVVIAYYSMYHSSDWEQHKGWKAIKSRQVITPDHPEWPHNTSQKRTSKEQYYDLGFTKSNPDIKSGTGGAD